MVRPPAQGAGRRAAQRALGEDAGEVALVVDRAAAVGGRGAVLRRRSSPPARTAPRTGALPAQQLLGAGAGGSVVRPTALSAMPASAIVPPSIQTRRRGGGDRPVAGAPLDLLVRAARRPAGAAAGPRSASRRRRPRSCTGRRGSRSMPTTRSPSAPRITTRALTAVHTADRSSAASAWQSEPPIVPRLRTTGSAITCSASRKTGKRSRQQVGLAAGRRGASARRSAISPPSSRM